MSAAEDPTVWREKAQKSARCFKPTDWITLFMLIGITTLPIINLATAGYFSSYNIIYWEDYYNPSSGNWRTYTSRNDSVANATEICAVPSTFYAEHMAFDCDEHGHNCTNHYIGQLPVNISADASINVSTLGARGTYIYYNDTADYHYTKQYTFPRQIVSDLFIGTMFSPILQNFIPSNLSAWWDYTSFYIYIRDGTGIAKGWKFCNQQSANESDYHRVDIAIGNGSIVQADVYYVNVSYNQERAEEIFGEDLNSFGFVLASILALGNQTLLGYLQDIMPYRPLNFTRVIPFVPEVNFQFDLLGFPIEFSFITDALNSTFQSTLLVADQLFGFYQWYTQATEISYAVELRAGLNSSAVKDYFQPKYGTLSFLTPDMLLNNGTVIGIGGMDGYLGTYTFSFYDLNVFLGRLYDPVETIQQIFLFDGILLAMFIGVIIFVHAYRLPGYEKYKERVVTCSALEKTGKEEEAEL